MRRLIVLGFCTCVNRDVFRWKQTLITKSTNQHKSSTMWADSSYDRSTCYRMINVHNSVPQSIVIKEVAIKSSLHGSSDPSDPVTVHLFSVVASNPVQNIECSIESEENHVAGGEILDLLVLLKHDDLRHNANGLQVDGECPSVLS